MTRRALLSFLAYFRPRPTTTLSAAPLDSPTVITVSPAAIGRDTPFLILTEEISIAELTRRYPRARQ